MTHYKLRTAEFDLSSKDGRAAFDKYASSGELPFEVHAGGGAGAPQGLRGRRPREQLLHGAVEVGLEPRHPAPG
jgi:hypothetical protein